MPATLQPPKSLHAAPSSGSPVAAPTTAQWIEWTSWPLRDRLSELWWAPVGVLLLSAAAAMRLSSPACGLGVAAALGITLTQLWLPVRFALTRDGLEASSPLGRRCYAWSQIRAARWEPGAVTLFVRPVQGRLRPQPMIATRVPLPGAESAARPALMERLSNVKTLSAA